MEKGQPAGSKRVLITRLIALVPIILFGLLLYFSRRYSHFTPFRSLNH